MIKSYPIACTINPIFTKHNHSKNRRLKDTWLRECRCPENKSHFFMLLTALKKGTFFSPRQRCWLFFLFFTSVSISWLMVDTISTKEAISVLPPPHMEIKCNRMLSQLTRARYAYRGSVAANYTPHRPSRSNYFFSRVSFQWNVINRPNYAESHL